MCGIVGIVAKQHVNQALFDALTALQHRGQDAAGAATCHKRKIHLYSGKGLVRDVLQPQQMQKLLGTMGIAHVRYPTAGDDSAEEAQPFYVNSPYGICLAHNGNLTNSKELLDSLHQFDLRHVNTASDSEILLNVFASELQNIKKPKLQAEDIFHAVTQVQQRCRGAYAVVLMIAGVGLVAFRDRFGIRPLIYGKRESELGSEYLIASESVALDTLGFKKIADVKPGEAIFISATGEVSQQQCVSDVQATPCLFEFVYFARPDSIIDHISVYKTRLRLGEKLAKKIVQAWSGHDIDVVMPIPETSRTAAAVLARRLGLKFRDGFFKNSYIGRTFIMPGQVLRQRSVRQKLNTIPLEFQDKNVLLVDDSIVRGTTSKEIIQMARDAGARNVYFASAAPEVCYPNVYGIDIPAPTELIAHGRSTEEIARLIGADRLIFQDLNDLIAAVKEGNPTIEHFEDSVFTGNYVTGDVDAGFLAQLAERRSEVIV